MTEPTLANPLEEARYYEKAHRDFYESGPSEHTEHLEMANRYKRLADWIEWLENELRFVDGVFL